MTEQNIKRRSRLTVIAISLLFLAPLLLSWWFLNYSEHVKTGDKSNHGDLIVPARQLPEAELVDPLAADKTRPLYGRWSLVYLLPDDCDEACDRSLFSLNQIEQMLGKDSLRVQRVVVIRNDVAISKIPGRYPGQWLLKTAGRNSRDLMEIFRLEGNNDPVSAGRVYLVDPAGNLMMSYPDGFDPYGLVKDLRLLLKASKIG